MAELHIRASLCLLAAVAITGCAPARPTMTPPAPSPTCTPEAGGKPYACTPYDHDQMIAKDKLYTEAERVYRRLLAEDERIKRAGGVREPTQVLLASWSGQGLTSAMDLYREFARTHAVASGGEFRLGYVHRVPGVSIGGSIVTLQGCIDSSTVTIKSDLGKERGTVRAQRVYFATMKGAIKATFSEWKEIPSCD